MILQAPSRWHWMGIPGHGKERTSTVSLRHLLHPFSASEKADGESAKQVYLSD